MATLTLPRLVLVISLATSCAAADTADTPCPDPPPEIAGEERSPEQGYGALIASHVVGGSVRYGCLAQRSAPLDRYVSWLGTADLGTLDRNERFAFWINAYNAFTLRLILDHYPGIDGIRDIPRGRRWKDARWLAAGRRVSLDQIEHEILRPTYRDPRLHFAIVCASVSCPELRAEPYTGERLDRQLHEQTTRFLRDRSRGVSIEWRGGRESPTVKLSALFDWFAEDFTRTGTVLEFVTPYLDEEARASIERFGKKVRIDYLDYDWSLNGS